ncbi:amino acid transporter [Marivivens niveibacter]|uniref:Amino acid transporter n=1 Tax=Marivivens niveibacter TaxID=1930667 RepID=A0A251X1A6_9RHOB|nr:LysE/ArgO family amino acid transporter [Marivivens niveibacter]OUD10376.1 amino acid transporter [Marivivens niveibacter]
MEFWIGLRTGIALILAIGAQNAFVLRQGVRREHVLAVVLVCAISDALLIAAGVAGIGALVEAAPWALEVLRWGGVAFLTWYGVKAFRAAYLGGETMEAAGGAKASLKKVITTCVALTWLNPHVYLDTVVLLGSISAQFPGREWVFGAGAMLGSVLFFSALGFGARLLAPVFRNPTAWRILDVLVGLLMWSVALKLAFLKI